jgi:hypothetical protein
MIRFASKICLQETLNPENSLKFNLKNRKFKFQHVLNNFQKSVGNFIFFVNLFPFIIQKTINKKVS